MVVRRAEITGWSGRGGDFFFQIPHKEQPVSPPSQHQHKSAFMSYIFNVHHLKKKNLNHSTDNIGPGYDHIAYMQISYLN